MKHNIKITLILLGMFIATQLIGLYVINIYSPHTIEIQQGNETLNVTSYDLPYGFNPPQGVSPELSLISIAMALIIAVFLMLFLMRFKLELILRIWFFIVIILAVALTLNALFGEIPGFYAPSILALIVAVILAYQKIFKRDLFIHNLTELIVYPGLAAIFVPWFNLLTISLFLVFISAYDIWAVNHTGHMQKMASYQIKTLRVFGGLLLPHVSPKDKLKIKLLKQKYKAQKKPNDKAINKELKAKKIRINMAVLGGGDIAWPLIFSGVVFHTLGLIPALITIIGSTAALAYLFYVGEEKKAYPAMPYITVGLFIALGLVYLLTLL